MTSPFGAGTFYNAETGEAYMPDNWREGIKWLYAGWHEDHFIPNYDYQQSDMLLAGNVFNSGNVAMASAIVVHLLSTGCSELGHRGRSVVCGTYTARCTPTFGS